MVRSEYITQEGLNKLYKEVEKLETLERPKISKQISEARDKGDISENAEYEAAKEAQLFLEMKISKIKNRIINSRVINFSQIDHSKVSILSTVKIKNLLTKEEHVYTLVPEVEANLNSGKISINTPISIGLLGKKIGNVARICLPGGSIIKYKILDIIFKKK